MVLGWLFSGFKFRSEGSLRDNIPLVNHANAPSAAETGPGSPNESESSFHAFGVAKSKPLVPWTDILAIGIALACLACAVIVVTKFPVLAISTYDRQIIALGFLLSVMNQCLRYLLPTCFHHLEARFGSSRLQNYQAIMLNSCAASQVDLVWRANIVVFLALPIALSIAYKNFSGGVATTVITKSDPRHNDVFGLYAPPGTQPLGTNLGLSFILNATSSVIAASRAKLFESWSKSADWRYSPSDEPPLPDFPVTFGLNTLVLDQDNVAMLDIPNTTWMHDTQQHTTADQAWTIEARVWATMVSSNSTVDAHRTEPPDSAYWAQYDPSQNGLHFISQNWSTIWLLENVVSVFSTTDLSWAFIAIVEENVDGPDDSFAGFAARAKMYNIQRQQCDGTWNIARGGAQLVTGHCDILSPGSIDSANQDIFTASYSTPSAMARVVLNENLGLFAGARLRSEWKDLVTTATLAAMRWGGVSFNDGPGSVFWDPSKYSTQMLYNTSATISIDRPALQKSPWLFVVLAIHPVLCIAVVAVNAALYAVPLGKGFSPIAVLAGLRPDSRSYVDGAGLSGEVSKKLYLSIAPDDKAPSGSRILYSIGDGRGNVERCLQRKEKYS